MRKDRQIWHEFELFAYNKSSCPVLSNSDFVLIFAGSICSFTQIQMQLSTVFGVRCATSLRQILTVQLSVQGWRHVTPGWVYKHSVYA